jgi:hypothetical protein
MWYDVWQSTTPEIQMNTESQADNQKIALIQTLFLFLIHQTKSSVDRKVEVVNKYSY